MRSACACRCACQRRAECMCSGACWGHGSCCFLPRDYECDIIARIAHLEEIEHLLAFWHARMRRREQRRSILGKWIGIGLAVLGIITVAFIVAGYLFPEWAANTRDIAVVILAVFQLISVILMI